jgi:hypothetical protein
MEKKSVKVQASLAVIASLLLLIYVQISIRILVQQNAVQSNSGLYLALPVAVAIPIIIGLSHTVSKKYNIDTHIFRKCFFIGILLTVLSVCIAPILY